MSYKKAPSIKHQEKVRKARYLREVSKGGVKQFLDIMTEEEKASLKKAILDNLRGNGK